MNLSFPLSSYPVSRTLRRKVHFDPTRSATCHVSRNLAVTNVCLATYMHYCNRDTVAFYESAHIDCQVDRVKIKAWESSKSVSEGASALIYASRENS